MSERLRDVRIKVGPWVDTGLWNWHSSCACPDGIGFCDSAAEAADEGREHLREAHPARIDVWPWTESGLWFMGCTADCADGYALDILPTLAEAADAGRRHLLAAHDDVLAPDVLIRLAVLTRSESHQGDSPGPSRVGMSGPTDSTPAPAHGPHSKPSDHETHHYAAYVAVRDA